jgi:hypothetical protein
VISKHSFATGNLKKGKRAHTNNLTSARLDHTLAKLIQGKALDDTDRLYFDTSKIPGLYEQYYRARECAIENCSAISNLYIIYSENK